MSISGRTNAGDITRIYRHQLAACTCEVLPGPGKLLRWSVPASRGHDDLLISTALTARLDALDWRDRTARAGERIPQRGKLCAIGCHRHDHARRRYQRRSSACAN